MTEQTFHVCPYLPYQCLIIIHYSQHAVPRTLQAQVRDYGRGLVLVMN